jgi:hypothetical protein
VLILNTPAVVDSHKAATLVCGDFFEPHLKVFLVDHQRRQRKVNEIKSFSDIFVYVKGHATLQFGSSGRLGDYIGSDGILG